MRSFFLILPLLLGLHAQCVAGANILFYLAFGSHSHRTAIEPLAHKLVNEGGHNVTFLTPISPTVKNPKFVEFSPKELTDFYTEFFGKDYPDIYFQGRLIDKYSNISPNPRDINEFEELICGLVFNSPEFKPWVARSTFDLVIIDHTGNKCAYALAYKYGAPTIVNMAIGPWAHEEDQFGHAFSDVAWVPNHASTNVFTNYRTFFDKVYVILYRLYSFFHTNWIALPKTDRLARSVLDLPDMPPIEELEKNTSLILENQHFSVDYPRALTPHVIQVGGMHCDNEKATEALPKNLQKFIDGAGEAGFVFVSFGTLVKMSTIPNDLQNSFFDAIKKTKTRFLWKWEGKAPENLPSNVLTAEWFPQQALLASKSIRAFITHGGKTSIYQAVCHGVPMIVVPIAFDQPYNAQSIQHHGIGIHVELTEMKEKFDDALNAILNDKKYQENAKMVSSRFNDQPMSPVDTAYFWTNYVLKHGDVSFMRPTQNLKQTWWQRRLLDVWAFLFTLITIFIWLFYHVIKFCLKSLFSMHRSTGARNKSKTS